MKKDLIDTIMEKDFHALTDVERKELAAFCSSEDEYNQMKDVFIGVEQMKVAPLQPKAETKQRLDDLFDSTYPKVAPIWYSSMFAVVVPKGKPVHRQPLAQIAAIALLCLLLVPFWDTNSTIVDKPIQVAEASPVEVNTSPNNDVTESPVVEVSDVEPVKVETKGVQSAAAPVLIASAAEPIPSDFNGIIDLASSPGTTGSNHPDGVFVAVSQPASENPEMFDLLTATF